MRRYLVAVAMVLALHTAAAFGSRTYAGLLLDVGGLFVHNTDIASIADRGMVAFAFVGAILMVTTILIVYCRGAAKA